MKSLSLVLLCVPLILCAGQTADRQLFPTGKGSKWTYKGTSAGKPLTTSATITGSEASKGQTRKVTMEWKQGSKEIQTEVYYVGPNGVTRAQTGPGGSFRLEPQLPLIKYPMTVGKSWTWSGTVLGPGGMKLVASATLKVGAYDNVTTGKGVFRAYRVDLMLTAKNGAQTEKMPSAYWFAPGVGMVRQRVGVPGPGLTDAVLSTYTSNKFP